MADVLVNVGRAWIVNKLNEDVQTTGDYIAWGTGAGIASETDTALFAESPDEIRTVAVRTKPSVNQIQWKGRIMCAANPKIITNVGNFTAASGGTLIVHGDFTGVPLAVGDSLEFTIVLEF